MGGLPRRRSVSTTWKTVTYRVALRVLANGGSRAASVLPGLGGWSVVGASSPSADLVGILGEHRHALLADGVDEREAERLAEEWVAADDEPGEPCPCSDDAGGPDTADRIVDALSRKPTICDDAWRRIIEEHGPFAEEMNAAASELEESLASLDKALREIDRRKALREIDRREAGSVLGTGGEE